LHVSCTVGDCHERGVVQRLLSSGSIGCTVTNLIRDRRDATSTQQEEICETVLEVEMHGKWRENSASTAREVLEG
jgi:hypothetical protein